MSLSGAVIGLFSWGAFSNLGPSYEERCSALGGTVIYGYLTADKCVQAKELRP